jgi:VWFA-related protein
MLFIFRLATFVATGIVASLAQGWTKPYPLKLGGVAAVIIGAVLIAVLWSTRTRPVKAARGRESGLREVLMGTVAAAVWFGSMHLYFQVAEQTTGFAETVLDRDREAIERDATLLENAGNFKEAADVILKALNEPHSSEFVKSFAGRAVLNLAKASKTADRDTAKGLLKQASEVATRFNVPEDLPALALERLQENNAVRDLQQKLNGSGEAARKAQAERDRLATDLQSLQTKQAEWEQKEKARAAELKRRFDSLNDSLARLAESAVLHAAALSGNVVDGDLQAARETLVRFLQQTGKNDGAGKAALENLEAAILGLRPVDLPAGTTAHIRRIDTNVMPEMVLVDVEVFDATGKPIDGLLGKDFVAMQSGAKLKPFASPFSKTESLAASILIDTSSSTEGAPIAATKTAVPEFISRLSANASIRVASFSDRLNLLCDFTQDKHRAVAAVNRIRADGGTALYQSALDEIRVLSTKSGVRVLVVFTDGANSLPGRVEEVIHAARNANVAVHFVALKGAGYSDTSAIENVASQTGGKTFLVQEASRLIEAFRSLSASLQHNGYRLALFNYDAHAPVQITIGGAAAIQLAVESSEAIPPLARRQAR